MHQMSYYYLILRYPRFRKTITDMYLNSQYERLFQALVDHNESEERIPHA